MKDLEGTFELWTTNEDGSKVGKRFEGNVFRSVVTTKMYQGWKEQPKILILDLYGQELEEYYKYLSEELQFRLYSNLTHERRVQSLAFFPQGVIGMASPVFPSAERGQ